MSRAKDALKRYVSGFQLGDAVASEAIDTPAALQQLTMDLKQVSSQNKVYFSLCFSAVVLVLIGAAVIVFHFLDDPEKIKGVFAVTGLSVVGLMGQMTSLWKQKVTSDLILVLCRNLNASDIRPMVELLFSKI